MKHHELMLEICLNKRSCHLPHHNYLKLKYDKLTNLLTYECDVDHRYKKKHDLTIEIFTTIGVEVIHYKVVYLFMYGCDLELDKKISQSNGENRFERTIKFFAF